VSQQFQAEEWVFCNGLAANGKSIVDMLSLGSEFGARLELEVSGHDAEEAASTLWEPLEARFFEAAHVSDESVS
jgi:phosphotransferase system HPr (HPr) family protein